MVQQNEIEAAVARLRRGGVVAFPTETVYGLGADASNPAAVQRIFSIKGRPSGHPLIVHLSAAAQLEDWVSDIPARAYDLAKYFWPGPLTLILKRAAQVPLVVTGGQNSVGLRVPNHPVALSLLRAFGGGIAAPSANRFGRISPTRAEHVRAELGTEVDFVLDGGACEVGLESTIVSLVEKRPRIVRPGAIPATAIAAVLGCTMETVGTSAARAPGTLPAHYATRTPLRIVPVRELEQAALSLLAERRQIGVLELEPGNSKLPPTASLHRCFMPGEPEGYARRLYATLRRLDEGNLDWLLVEAVPNNEAWLAVNDRLRRAANAHS